MTWGFNMKEKMYLFIKRVFDLFVSFIGILIFLPVLGIVKLCYVISGDFEPVLFTQRRIGKDGVSFKFYKFRTMVRNADGVLKELMETDPAIYKEYTMYKKLSNDPRVTPIGRILRKTSLDEIPQFLNVFKGDMSVVGNRPYLPREEEDMGRYFDEIVKTKPGITGYWQVYLRSNGSFKERLKMEKYYSNHYSLLLDIKIFFMTFIKILPSSAAK